MITLRLDYYAVLRDQRGAPREELTTAAATPRELYEELRVRHGFTLGPDQVKVALNGEFAGWETPLRAGDQVVFLPPVAGG